MAHKLEIPKTFENTYETPIASSYGEGSNKKLMIRNIIDKDGNLIHSCFIVKNHDQVTLASNNMMEAVIEYNSLT